MALSRLIRYLVGPAAAVVLSGVLLAALLMLTSAAQHSAVLGEMYSHLLLVNVLGIGALLALICVSLYRLVRQFRARVLGSRLTVRLLVMLGVLLAVPLTTVYYFSVQFLSRGIDSWFDVRIEQALQDALLLGRTSLEALKQDAVSQVQDGAARLAEVQTQIEYIHLLDDLREQAGFQEMSLYTQTGRIIASSSAEATTLVPDTPTDTILAQVRAGQVYAGLEPVADAGLQLRILVPVPPRNMSEPALALQGLQPLPLRFANLGESVQNATAEYEQLVFLRGPLKFSFVLTLTLVTLMTLLLGVWAAIFFSRRFVKPLRDLAEGTRLVAEGRYDRQLPVTSSDELGVLVQSFNEMTRRVHQAQSQARRSQRVTEEQRAYLETVLGHLSSGVLSFDHHGRLRTDNPAATHILEIDFTAVRDRPLAAIAVEHPRIAPFADAISGAIARNASDWQSEVALTGGRGRQRLLCRGTRLGRDGGWVVVFDDVTDLIRAQRDAAWGDVARRLAHEIKNPLTPIQLSAERLRRKYLLKLEAGDRDTLDRATRTIVQQVESMKAMVNAFATYAQTVQMQPARVAVNDLLRDVAELHLRDDRSLTIRLALDAREPVIVADADRLRQVVNNLLVNARDAAGGGVASEVEIVSVVTGAPGSETLEIIVRDNGRGFNDDLLERVFEPYVTTKEKGTGLGLAIVKRIVDEHGGSVWVANRPEGGAQVTVLLPFAVDRTTEYEGRLSAAGGDQRP